MTKITPEIIDDLILETLAEYQKALEDQSVTGNAPAAQSEPESKTDPESSLCPVAEQVAALTEQVAYLTEKLDCAMHRIAELDEMNDVHRIILETLINIAESQSNSLALLTDVTQATLREVRDGAGHAVTLCKGAPKDVHQLLASILGELPKATK